MASDALEEFASELPLDLADELRLSKSRLLVRELAARPAATLRSVAGDIGSVEELVKAGKTLKVALTPQPNFDVPPDSVDGVPCCTVCGETGDLVDQNESLDDPNLVCSNEDACQVRRAERFPPALPASDSRQSRALDRVTSASAAVDAIRALGSVSRERTLGEDVLQLSAGEQLTPAMRRVAAHELSHAWVARQLGGEAVRVELTAGGGRTVWQGLEGVSDLAAVLAGYVYDRQQHGLDVALAGSWADLARVLDALPEDEDAAAGTFISALELAEQVLESVDLSRLVPDEGPLPATRKPEPPARAAAPSPVPVPLPDYSYRLLTLGHPGNRAHLLSEPYHRGHLIGAHRMALLGHR